jgi:hypothetical protein
MKAFNFSNIFWDSALIVGVYLILFVIIIVISGIYIYPDAMGDGLYCLKVEYFAHNFTWRNIPTTQFRNIIDRHIHHRNTNREP